MRKFVYLVIVVISALLFSCSKEETARPAVAPANADAAVAQVAAAPVLTSPVPGNYNVSLYVDDADTSTADFKGYVFTFVATGKLTAKVDSVTYTGKWESRKNGTELKIDIDGTPQLHEIKQNWNVVKYTNTAINLNAPEHGIPGRDVLNFTKL